MNKISLIDFIKGYIERDEFVDVSFYFYFDYDSVSHDEYSFEGKPSDFVEKYTNEYDCIDGLTIDDLECLQIRSRGSFFRSVFMTYRSIE